MLFNSIIFMFYFLPIVIVIYFCINRKYRNLFLLLSSLFFYGFKEPVFILIMLFSIMLDYNIGKRISKCIISNNKILAKKYVVSSIVINLSLLFFFKYYGLFSNTINSISSSNILPDLNLGLPIGISFYTFQTMSYAIDLYRGDAKEADSIIGFGTYVTLFAQLIAGPIVRYKDIYEQLKTRQETLYDVQQGIYRFMIGLSKKIIIADNIGVVVQEINQLSGNEITFSLAWLGLFSFGLQIYFDFSGYSDMAIGLARIFGFTFLENFNYPYISKSVTEFWRRWHISLGNWFRDYVYIPLGGNKKGIFFTYRNLFITWLATGIWHGSSWNFILWGLYFAIIIITEKLFLLKFLSKLPNFIQYTYSLFLVFLGWYLFIYVDLNSGLDYLKVLFTIDLRVDSQAWFYLSNNIFYYLIAIIGATPIVKKYYSIIRNNVIDNVLLTLSLIICTALLVDSSFNPFLYFRF